MITEEEIQLVKDSLEYALDYGAQAVRLSFVKSVEDLVATLDGKVDKVTRCADRSLSIALFVDGRFGSFSINKMEPGTLQDFISRAIETVRMLNPDSCRKLPDPSRYCNSALSGTEMEICDPAYYGITPEDRRRIALAAAVTCHPERTFCHPEACPELAEGRSEGSPARLVSEEGEYSDSIYDTYVIDSQGLECRHTETSFDYGVEVTVEDAEGNKYSDYWWTASPRLSDFDPSECGHTAVDRACAQIGSTPAPSGKYNMVVRSSAASRLVSPLLNALNAYSIQQGNSFLVDSEGKQLFSPRFTLVDEPWRKGESGSKLFDGEGVATSPCPIITSGTVRRYFINTYMSEKLGVPPTQEDAIRPRVFGWPNPGLDENALMGMCGDGILVTDFNGGNCNMTTGDFSYGISGQLFKNGKPVRPVSEMLVTGNFLNLWKNLEGVGEDYRPCMTKLIGALAFSDVDFSG